VISILAIYILASRLVMRWLGGGAREVIIALLNLAGVYACFFHDPNHPHEIAGEFIFYVFIVAFQFVMLRLFSEGEGWLPWLAFFAPLAPLLYFRYGHSGIFEPLWRSLGWNLSSPAPWIGISYLAFRCSRLVLEVRNRSVKKPDLWQYLGFSFFLPTMSLGPINTYANYRRGFEDAPWEAPMGRAALRILIGLVKYEFLGGICNQLTYSGFLLDGHPHHWIELPVAMVFYCLYLYCNFSGFCDMAIGAAALIGIPVLENFNNPFATRNLKEFWNCWHITLSQWMRDILFAPLSKFLVRVMGPARVNHAIALAIFVVFLLIGIWHGAGWHYAIFGVVQAIGVVANHYYTIGLKKWLGRGGFKAYNENRWIHAVAVVSTFCYFAASLLFFANSIAQIKHILRILR
jgi:D-alanyl-lipoteichoic acid acyltransferase DltB (MBOAT superfamily)